MTPDQRLFWVKRLTLIFLGIGMALSFPLWLNERELTLVPPFDVIPVLSPPWDMVLLGLIGVLMMANFIFVLHKFSSALLPILLLLLMFQDYTRFQPWYWQYVWLLIIIIPYAGYYKIYRERDHLYQALLIGFVACYLWAGVFKINEVFVPNLVPYLVSPITNYLVTYKHIIHPMGHLLPYSEILLALGLLFHKTRKPSVILGVGFHLGIAVLFSPWGLNTNLIIIPWNVFLAIALPLLFWGYSKPLSFKMLPKLPSVSKLGLAIFFVLPALNFFGVYNKSLAFELYSGNNFVSDLEWKRSEIKQIPPSFEPYVYAYGDMVYLKTYVWGTELCKVPPNPDPRALMRMQECVLKEFQ
ncbi:MAG: hypothetical protein KDC83_13650 [Flavobacteriales bacterium]|nr:hypothetical protein [Flavobacteriales bacterium]